MGGQFDRRELVRRPVQEVAEIKAAVYDEISSQAVNPPGNDPAISALWRAYQNVGESAPLLKETVESSMIKKKLIVVPWSDSGVPVSEEAGTIRLGFQYSCVRFARSRVPSTVLGWERVLKNIDRDPVKLAVLGLVLGKYAPRTSIGERNGPLEVLRQIDGDPSGQGLGLCDVGAGAQVGVKQMQLKHAFPFPDVQLMFPDGSPDEIAATGYANLIGRPAIGGDIVTVDLMAPDDKMASQLALASMRQSEIMDTEFRRKYRQLVRAKVPRLHFMRGDITNRKDVDDIRRQRDALGLAPPRHVFLGTMLNQIGQDMIGKALKNALSLLDDGDDRRKVVFAEFGLPDRRDPRKFSLLPHWGDYTYGYFGINGADDDAVIQHYFTFKTSRPSLGYIHNGQYMADRLLPIREHLLRALGGAAFDSASSPPRFWRTIS